MGATMLRKFLATLLACVLLWAPTGASADPSLVVAGLPTGSGLSIGPGLSSGNGFVGGNNVLYANLTSGAIPSWLGYASAGLRYYFDASGNLQTAPNNSVPNATMVGAQVGIVGSGGAGPSGWLGVTSGGTGSFTTQIVAAGIVNGLNYIDLRVYGTSTATTANLLRNIQFANGNISASTGQRFVSSISLALVAGTLPSTASLITQETGGVTNYPGTGFTLTSTLTQYYFANTTTTSGLTYILPSLWIYGPTVNPTNVDFTIRIAAPQVSLITAAQTTPSPFMPTSGSAYFGPVVNDHNPATLASLGPRSEPQRTNLFLNNLSPSTQTIPVASGTTHTISFYGTGAIAWTGACTGSLTGTGATTLAQTSCTTATTSLVIATLTGSVVYPQVEASAFATSRILTAGTSVTVPADNWSFTGAALAQIKSGAACIAVEALAEGTPSSWRLFEASDGTLSNRVVMIQTSNITGRVYVAVNGPAVRDVTTSGGDVTTAPRRSVVSYSLVAPAIAAYDGALAGAGLVNLAGAPTNMTQALLGSTISGTGWSGWIQQIMVRPSCTAGQVQRLSTAGANLQASNDNAWPMFAANDNLPVIVKIASGGW